MEISKSKIHDFAKEVEIKMRECALESAWVEVLLQVRQLQEKEQGQAIGLIGQYNNGYFSMVELLEHLTFIHANITPYANAYFKAYTNLNEYKECIASFGIRRKKLNI